MRPNVDAAERSPAEGLRASPPPDVSVIVIFKDAAAFLEEAIGSVLAQTLVEWELILVDDGSSDGSTEIARGHVERDPERVRYVEHPGHANLGMSATRNLGLANARGEFVAFLDADDALIAEALDDQVEILRRHPQVGMVYGPLEYWYGWTGTPKDRDRDFVYPVGVPADRVYEPPSLIALFVQDIAFSPSGMLLRRELAESVGGFEVEFRDLYEDQVFAAKVCRHASVYVSSRCSYRYRQHPDSCCLVAARDGRLDASRGPFLRWLMAYLEAEGLAGSEAWRVARRELRQTTVPGRLVLRALRTPQLVRRLATQVLAPRGARP